MICKFNSLGLKSTEIKQGTSVPASPTHKMFNVKYGYNYT